MSLQFKQYQDANGNPTLNGTKLLQIAKFMYQATPNNTPSFGKWPPNANGSAEFKMVYPNGDEASVAAFIDAMFDKLVLYSQQEFKWVGGVPVPRPVPLIPNPDIDVEKLNAALDRVNKPYKPSTVAWLYSRIEEVFSVDLSTFVVPKK